MHLLLIGYRGTGKSTVARLLAERLGRPFVDTDEMVEQQAGQSIAEIFLHRGEQEFRDLEAAALAEACQGDPAVIAAGGGVVLREASRDLAARRCKTIWLTAPVDEIERRIQADQTTAGRRPSLTNLGGRTEIERLLEIREPFYRQCADLVVDTDGKAPAQIAEEILVRLNPPFKEN